MIAAATHALPAIRLGLLVCLTLLLGVGPLSADMLRGHLSGFESHVARIDLRVRFFAAASAGNPLAERHFHNVALNAGDFSVPLNPLDLPQGARFVEIAQRPSERRYAAYQGISPRRSLRRMPGDVLFAAVPEQNNALPTAASPSVPLNHGDLE